MNREEFLRQFREALEGKVSERVISENITYYRDYINHQVNSGRSEGEVLRELGDPRLLAKTIEESSRFTKGAGGNQRSYGSTAYEQGSYEDATGQQGNYHNGDYGNKKVTTVPLWVVVLIGLLIVVLVIVVVFQIFTFFLPFILVGLAVTIAYRFIKSIFQ